VPNIRLDRRGNLPLINPIALKLSLRHHSWGSLGAAMERDKQEIARIFGLSMAFFDSLCVLAIMLSSV
jgi:hypothetical protein